MYFVVPYSAVFYFALLLLDIVRQVSRYVRNEMKNKDIVFHDQLESACRIARNSFSVAYIHAIFFYIVEPHFRFDTRDHFQQL